MTKAQIHFSNYLEELLIPLKENLFPQGAGPFDKRLIIVPHLRLKDYIMRFLAKDKELQVAAGVQVVSLTQGLSKLSKKNLPTKLELSLSLQYHLLPLIDEHDELKKYFDRKSREKRIGPFCDIMAESFLRYAIYGKPSLPLWQEKLWKVFDWSFPRGAKTDWQVHVWGFSFLPLSYMELFEKVGARFYCFSPCQIFWADFYSEKEKSFLEQKVPEKQLDIFVESFEDQNPLLANWGRVGRKMLLATEESGISPFEHYVEPKKDSCLGELQSSFLFGDPPEVTIDKTLSAFSASTKLREIEILKDQLLRLFDEEGIEPRDVQVFAPDISQYSPFIQGVFKDLAHSIYDLPLSMVDREAKAFAKLLELPKERFALEEVLEVLGSMKFGIDIGLCRKWLESANVRWGYSEEQRKAFYLEDVEEIAVNPSQGTWQYGLRRLLLGLGNFEGEEAPLAAISVSEMEMFNTLYVTMESLADDLSCLYDKTEWTIPTWLRYFACLFESYFSIDPSHDLYKELLKLASSYDHLDKETIPYPGIQRVLSSLLNKRAKSIQAPHLQAVQFSSFSTGCIQPGKVICLIGLEEESFPAREDPHSLSEKETTYRPTKTEEERYLFLQALLSAREFFQLSYVRDQAGKLGAALPFQELFAHLKDSEIIHHPAMAHDPKYFGGELVSYNQQSYHHALERQNPVERLPLILDFYEPKPFTTIIKTPIVIEMQKLAKFAKHPLRYHLQEVLGIYPDFKKNEEGEYLLTPLLKNQLVRSSLETSVDQVLIESEKKGELPLNLLKPLAKQQIETEVEEWKGAMEEFGVSRIFTQKIDLQIGDVHLVGKIDGWTEKGVFVKGKNCLEDQIRFWPIALIAQKSGIPLIGIKDKQPLDIEGSLEEYLDYFRLAKEHPSPLLPAFARALLEGSSKDLHKELKKIEDDVFSYLYFRDPMPSAQVIHDRWSPYLQNIFGRIDAKV